MFFIRNEASCFVLDSRREELHSSVHLCPVILSGVSKKSQMSHVSLFLTVCTCFVCTCFSSKRPTQCFTLESRSLSELLHRAVHKANSGRQTVQLVSY